MSNIDQLVLQAKTCFQAKDYETCMSLTDEALRADPSNTEASWLMKEAQRQWEDQRSLEQLEIYVENLKKEAMDLFDKEKYEQCLGMFRFLLELEPENHTLQDYVRLSQQMFVETIGSGEPTANEEGASISASDLQKQSEAFNLSPTPLETDSHSRSPAAEVPELDGRTSESDSATRVPETGAPWAVKVNDDAIPQSLKRKIILEYLASTRPARRSWTLRLATALILVTILGAGCFWLYSSFFVSRIEILSAPENASVFIDNKGVGETPFRQEHLPSGNHVLRIERQGYLPLSHNITVRRAQAIILSVQLERAKTATSSSARPTVPLELPAQSLAPPTVSELAESAIPTVQIAQSVIHHHMLGSCTG
ncbi:MAG: PEGA domain-containing protein, partial [Terriglobia bacterium]